jgi:glycosyltransferase involved in cell wall biosynthesis
MKVLLVHNSYQQPGGEDVVFDLERRFLEGAGHEVVAYRRSNWEIQAQSAIGRLALGKNVVWCKESRREIATLLDHAKPDLVHVHNTFVMISPSIYSACRAAHVPVVQTLHNYRLLCPAAILFRGGDVCEECIEHGLWRGVWHGCYRHSRAATAATALMLCVHRWLGTWSEMVDCYIALTEFARAKFIEGGLPAEKIVVKPNFVHPDPLAVAAMSPSPNSLGGRRPPLQGNAGHRPALQEATVGTPPLQGEYALFIGRLYPEKRVRTVLDAWERLHDDIPLLVVGGGPQRAELEALAAKRGLSSVSFQGHLPHDRTLAAIEGARFLVFASEWYEGFPVTIAEAFACGVPVVASRLGAMQEIVEDSRTGLHFSPGDADDLTAKVEWAWTHPREMEAMGRAARAEYEAKYTAERNYQMLMGIYRRVMKSTA